MKVLHLRVGAIDTNCYIVMDENTKEGVIIDPGDDAKSILKIVHEEKINIKYILLTHAHFDHILAVADIQRETNAQLVLHEADEGLLKEEAMGEFRPFVKGRYTEPKMDIRAKEGTQVQFGSLTATYLHTPGHTPGSCTIRIGDCLFTGDTMFRHECGRCDLPGGDFDEMLCSLRRLSELPGDYQILPGHEGFSTLDEERHKNPFVLQALAQ